MPMGAATAVIVLAAGCFWSVELVFQRLPGVISTRVGYIGGDPHRVTYAEVSTGTTGHAEAVEVQYDPEQVSHSDVLELFFRIHDPTTPDRQGADVGSQYRSALWLSNAAQSSAFAKLRVLHDARFPDPIVTEVHELADATFFAAEEYHQRYLEKGGQSAVKGDLTPVQCYGSRGPLKVLDKPGLRDLFERRVDL